MTSGPYQSKLLRGGYTAFSSPETVGGAVADFDEDQNVYIYHDEIDLTHPAGKISSDQAQTSLGQKMACSGFDLGAKGTMARQGLYLVTDREVLIYPGEWLPTQAFSRCAPQRPGSTFPFHPKYDRLPTG